MTSDAVGRSIVAMFDLEHDDLAKQHLPMPLQRRVVEAIHTLRATYPFPSFRVHFGPKRRPMSLSECQKIFIEAYDVIDQNVQPILESNDKTKVRERMEMLVVRGQLSLLTKTVASLG